MKLKKVDLQSECEKRDLAENGTKAVIVNRILNSMRPFVTPAPPLRMPARLVPDVNDRGEANMSDASEDDGYRTPPYLHLHQLRDEPYWEKFTEEELHFELLRLGWASRIDRNVTDPKAEMIRLITRYYVVGNGDDEFEARRHGFVKLHPDNKGWVSQRRRHPKSEFETVKRGIRGLRENHEGRFQQLCRWLLRFKGRSADDNRSTSPSCSEDTDNDDDDDEEEDDDDGEEENDEEEDDDDENGNRPGLASASFPAFFNQPAAFGPLRGDEQSNPPVPVQYSAGTADEDSSESATSSRKRKNDESHQEGPRLRSQRASESQESRDRLVSNLDSELPRTPPLQTSAAPAFEDHRGVAQISHASTNEASAASTVILDPSNTALPSVETAQENANATTNDDLPDHEDEDPESPQRPTIAPISPAPGHRLPRLHPNPTTRRNPPMVQEQEPPGDVLQRIIAGIGQRPRAPSFAPQGPIPVLLPSALAHPDPSYTGYDPLRADEHFRDDVERLEVIGPARRLLGEAPIRFFYSRLNSGPRPMPIGWYESDGTKIYSNSLAQLFERFPDVIGTLRMAMMPPPPPPNQNP